MTEEKTALRVRNVAKSYAGHQVLHDLSLDVPVGRTLCLIGPSGSGKSTLLRCLNLLERPDSGQVWFGDECLTDRGVDLNRARARMGTVFQQFNLFAHLTVERNITIGLTKVKGLPLAEARQIAAERLRDVGLAGLGDRRPAQLSGGQQQRVAIARALAMRPDVLLFDEATSALDPELVKGVLDIMRGLAADGRTMVVVTHEMAFAREVADTVAFLADGRLVELGPPAELFHRPESARLRDFLDLVS